MATEIKACTKSGYRRRNAVIIAFILLLACFALVMVIYNLIKGAYLFSAAWLIATILAATYVFIRINTVFATYISVDRINLYMKNWSNDFFPYDYSNKIKILSEFIPAKTKLVEIPVNEIRAIYIGTKNFIKRNTSPQGDFTRSVAVFEKSKDFYRKRTITSMDIFYVETFDNECYYMPIVKYDTKNVIKIVQNIRRYNGAAEVRTSSREYRTLRTGQR